jgi:ubiquinone biosynthesis protein UbiJ
MASRRISAGLLDDEKSIRKIAAKALANALLGQLDAGRTFISIAKGRPFDEKHQRCIRSVKRILAYTNTEMWTLHLEPEDISEITAETDRLRLELDSLDTASLSRGEGIWKSLQENMNSQEIDS